MKVAVIGPITKDTVTISGSTKTYMGGIPYYEAHVFKILGAWVEAFITYAESDEKWVRKNFAGIKIHPSYTSQTLEGELMYSEKDPDTRKIIRVKYSPNIILPSESLFNNLKNFDYITFGPLYYENIPYEFFEKMKDRNLVLGNFGLFTYHENENLVHKNPENLARVAPFLKYLFLDENEAKFAAQKESIEKAAKYFLELGTEMVVVTKGSKGSVVFTKNKKYTISAFPPKKLIDPTGAGDTYLAAFIFATELFPNDIQRQGEFAAMTATMAIENAGAFDGTLEEVLKRLERKK